jgi:hypothetical protein
MGMCTFVLENQITIYVQVNAINVASEVHFFPHA